MKTKFLNNSSLPNKNIFAVIAFSLATTATMPCFATSFGPSPNLKTFTNEAKFVFQGVVENVSYKLSEPSSDGTQLPYTLVTFRVGSVLKGSASGSKVTLNFLGGLDNRNGLTMSTDQTPLFDVGDKDILFVTPNEAGLTPLVHNKEGRFRVLGGKVYSEEGQEITLGKDSSIHAGKRHEFSEVLSNQVGNNVMTSKSLGSAAANSAPSNAISVDAFTRAVGQTVSQAGLRSGAAQALATGFKGSDPSMPIAGFEMTAASPPKK